MAEPEGMDVDSPAVPSTSSGSNKKRFEVKKVYVFLNHYFSYLATLCNFLFFFKTDHFFHFHGSGMLLPCGHGVSPVLIDLITVIAAEDRNCTTLKCSPFSMPSWRVGKAVRNYSVCIGFRWQMQILFIKFEGLI